MVGTIGPMATLVLSSPFRFGPDGRAAVVDQDSEMGLREQIAALCLTRAGERRLRPGFGLTDPVFAGFEPSELAAKIALYGPPVELDDVVVTARAADVQHVEIDFHPTAAT